MTGLLRLDLRNGPARVAAIARLAVVPVVLLFEALETPASSHDLAFGEPVIAAFVVYALIAALYAFRARREVPLGLFALADTVLLSLVVCAEGGAVADVRYILFVPVLAAVLAGPRQTLALAALSVLGFVAASLAHPTFGDEVSARLLAVHTLDVGSRAALAVVVSLILTRRAERIRELAESRRSLVAQALSAEARARRELSYALHDELVQELLCAQQDLKVARRGRPEYVDRAQLALSSAVQRLRHEIFQLHPHLLETAGLEAALGAVAAQQALAEGGRPTVAVVPAAAGVHDELLFSVGRELLTNAARHAGAARVELTVERRRDGVLLRCRDDGRGIAPGRRCAALADGHLGLAACTERVEALGGRLEIVTPPGGGAEVRAFVPDPPPPARALAAAPARAPQPAPATGAGGAVLRGA